MKIFTLISMLFCIIAMPARAELTDADLNKIRLIVNDSEKRIRQEFKVEIATVKQDLKAEIAKSEKNIKTYVDIKFESVAHRFESIHQRFESVDKQIMYLTYMTYGLIALIVAAVGIPQIIMVWRGESTRDQTKQIQELRQEIEALKRQQIIKP